jgi:molecular chaperone DnaK (HSP70)
VEKSYIGIRLADGRFFPIFDRNQQGRKRLVLTTVKDNQASVQIDLYRGIGEEMSEAEYVGTLVIQNVEEAGAGEPEISLVLGVDDSGNLNATAADEKSGEYESLSVSLESEVETESGDFELTDSDFSLDLDEEEAGEEAPSFEEAGLEDFPDEMELEDAFPEGAPSSEEAESERPEEAEQASTEQAPTEALTEPPPAESAPTEESDQVTLDDEELEDFSFDEDEEIDLGDLTFDDEPDAADETESVDDAPEAVGTETTEELDAFEESLEDFDTSGLDEEPAVAEMETAEGETSYSETSDFDAADSDFEVSDDFDYAEEPPQFDDHPEARSESEEGASASLGAGNILLFVAFMVLSLAGLGLLTYLIFQALRGPELPPLIGSAAAWIVDLLRGALTLL